MVIFENDNFIIDYNSDTHLMRISYFEDYHYKDETTFRFPFHCLDCKYLNTKAECTHPDAAYCHHGDLWWPKNK